MDILIKTAGVCLISAIISALLKKDSPAMTILLAAAAAGTVIYVVSDAVGEIVSLMVTVSQSANVEPTVLHALFKIIVMAIITRFVSDVCADAGMKAASASVEFAGNAAALFTAVPLIKTVYKMISDLM